MKLAIAFGLLATLLVSAQAPAAATTASSAKKGTVERIKVHGKSLEGNLEGDSPDREVFVYLPPSYATNKTRRYPVVYFLHGYGIGAERYWNIMTVPEAADHAMGSGAVKEMILVHPDAFTKYDGAMYSNSPTTGNWENYITQDLPSYIDTHYRTIAKPDSRGLAGHSMGGYGTFRIAMKYPGVFSSLYPMSSCCLMNNPQPPSPDREKAPVVDKGGKAKGGNGFANVTKAEGAAWSPNPKSPVFFDLPTEDGKFRPEIAAKWVANSPLAMLDQYTTNMKKYHAIMMDCGLSDGLITTNRQMDALLTQFDIAHSFETYDGDHNNRVKERFESKVMPFFSTNLMFAQAAPAKKPVAKKKTK